MKTTKSVIKEILFNIDFIYLSDLINKAAKETGYTKTSIRGTTFGSVVKYISEKWFYDNFVYYPQKDTNKPIIFKKSFINNVILFNERKPITVSYNTEPKKEARLHIFKNIQNIENPTVLTMASEEGFDVKLIKKLNPSARIYNVEKNKEILEEYKKNKSKNKLKSIDFHGTLNKFLLKRKNYKPFTLINYDTVGYLCQSISDDLLFINKYRKCEYLFLTISNIKKIRNRGHFAEYVKSKYIEHDNPTMAYIKEEMTNYHIISNYHYKQDHCKVGMQVIGFKLKQ